MSDRTGCFWTSCGHLSRFSISSTPARQREHLVWSTTITRPPRRQSNSFCASRNENKMRDLKEQSAVQEVGGSLECKCTPGLWFCPSLSRAIRKSHRCDSLRETWHLGNSHSVILLVVFPTLHRCAALTDSRPQSRPRPRPRPRPLHAFKIFLNIW